MALAWKTTTTNPLAVRVCADGVRIGPARCFVGNSPLPFPFISCPIFWLVAEDRVENWTARAERVWPLVVLQEEGVRHPGRAGPAALAAKVVLRHQQPGAVVHPQRSQDGYLQAVLSETCAPNKRKMKPSSGEILNKLTPDRFDKLFLELLNVGIENKLILKGIILLVFEKAIDEPKYCSMYAQLCRRLCDDAPNFDDPNKSGTTTFRRLLLNKCQDEFENRSKTFAAFDRDDGPLTPEQNEQKMVAKRKMLGNIRFIGELGKLDMLSEAILHKCIKQLLEKKRTESVGDRAEDLECLCQIMRTCGRRLDHDKAKSLMDQYFDRMRTLAGSSELPSRIRFMLEDCIELRGNNWAPRKIALDQGPRTIQQVREAAAKVHGVYYPPPEYGRRHQGKDFFGGSMKQLRAQRDMGGLSDVFGGPQGIIGDAGIGTGPGVIQDNHDDFPAINWQRNGNMRNQQNTGYNQFVGGGGGNQRQEGGYNQYQQRNANQQQQNSLPPRFMKKNQFNSGEISLRPTKDSMVFKPQGGFMPPSSKPSQGGTPPSGSPTPIMMQPPTIPIQQAKSSGDKSKKDKKQPPPSKEDLKKLTEEMLTEYLNTKTVDEAVRSVRDMRAPKKHLPELTCHLMTHALNKEDSDREAISDLIAALKKDGVISSEHFIEGFKGLPQQFSDLSTMSFQGFKGLPQQFSDLGTMSFQGFKGLPQQFSDLGTMSFQGFEGLLPQMSDLSTGFEGLLQQMSDLENDVPLIKSYTAAYAARAVKDDLVPLTDVAQPMENGAHYPLFLLVLQQLHKLSGRDQLVTVFTDSRINMVKMLPEIDQNKEKMMGILEGKGLSFLFPLLRMQAELWKALQADPTPAAIYKWIKDNVETRLHTDPGFVNVLMSSILKYVTQESTLGEDVDPAVMPGKDLVEKEKDLVDRLKPVLQKFLHEHVDLQVSALYALQVHCFNNSFPKGMLLRMSMIMYDLDDCSNTAPLPTPGVLLRMLLRMFMMMYDLEIAEEDAFFRWKEDINDEFPGKGKALFQVNTWLQWLETAEEDESEEEEDD
ncbi:Eukaryotic translation initiation factor 4 gamma 2 [Branchiostoma belcheri]|nr:Eukaryotic translation initiation factor 4 gamma 2 [Branchiostoma belcheri]